MKAPRRQQEPGWVPVSGHQRPEQERKQQWSGRARVSWSLPVVARAGSQVERCFELRLVQDDLIVGAAVHVGIGDPTVGHGIDESVGVVANLIRRGFGTTRFVENRVLVRVLRGSSMTSPPPSMAPYPVYWFHSWLGFRPERTRTGGSGWWWRWATSGVPGPACQRRAVLIWTCR